MTTDSKGYAELTPPDAVNLTMTATDQSGSTSEFSNERAVSFNSCGVKTTVTNDTTPEIGGVINTVGFTSDIPAILTTTVSSQTVPSAIRSGTWSVADNTFSPFAAGTYDVLVTYADPISLISSTYLKAGALTIDTTVPTVSIVRKSGQAQYTKTNSATFVVTLSEPAAVGTFTATDVNVGTTTGTVTGFTQIDSTHYEVTVTGMTSGDTATVTVPASSFADAAGNQNTASTGAPDNRVMYDVTSPLSFAINVTSTGSYTLDKPQISWSTTDAESGIDHYEISYDNGSFATVTSPQTPTLAATGQHKIVIRAYDKAGNMTEKTVHYPPIVQIAAPTTLRNQPITDTTIKIEGPVGMVVRDVTISGAGSSGFVCTPTPSTTTSVPVTCTGGKITTSGTLMVTATTDSGVVTSNSQDYVIDTAEPQVTVEQVAGQADPTNQNSAKFRVTFTKPVVATSFTKDDLAVSGTSGTVTGFAQIDSRTWDVEVTGMTSGDTAAVSLAAAKVQDAAGNQNFASTSTDNHVTYDAIAPTVTINQAAGQADPTNQNSIKYAIVFSKRIKALTTADIKLSGTTGAVMSLTTTDNITWEATVTGMASGDVVKATISAGVTLDDAGNQNTASTSVDNTVAYDAIAPTATVKSQVVNVTSPAVSGMVDDSTATVTVKINGTTYTAKNNGDGTWSLPAGTIVPALADGAYAVEVTVADAAGNTTTTNVDNALMIDTVAPTGTVTPPADDITNSPAVTGTVDDPTATVTVTVDGATYTAVNNGDGTWSLPAGTIAPGLAVGSHDVSVTFADTAGNTTMQQSKVTILRADADAPTVDTVTSLSGKPIITGTYDVTNTVSFRVRVGTAWYTKSSPELKLSGDTWTLDLSALSPALAPGQYDVVAETTTRGGDTIGDMSTNELTVIAPTIPEIITHPDAQVILANTGMPLYLPLAIAMTTIGAGVYQVKLLRRKKS